MTRYELGSNIEGSQDSQKTLLDVIDGLKNRDAQRTYQALESLSVALTDSRRLGGEDQLRADVTRFVQELEEPTTGLVYYLNDNYSRLLMAWDRPRITFTLIKQNTTQECKSKWLELFEVETIKVEL